jgi:proline iminopeptidase
MNETHADVVEGHAPVEGAELFYRAVGQGPPLVVIHGGPDFDHRYLVPGMDRLAERYRLIYYDQRGRGRSRGELNLDDIHIDKCVEDLDGLRRHLRLDAMAIAGHSWGGIVAMYYALRFPERLTHLVLMNTAPASHDDFMLTKDERVRRRFAHAQRLGELAAGYKRGDPDAVAEFYRIDYSTTFERPEEAARLNLGWTREQIASGRAIEDRLMASLMWSPGYTLLPALAEIRTPTLIVHGDLDFVPLVCATHIAEAIPGSRLVVLPGSGHFSYVDAADDLVAAMVSFFATPP